MINPRPHKKLKVWQKAIDLVRRIYKITDAFPLMEVQMLLSGLSRSIK